jgi:hypothetical protein
VDIMKIQNQLVATLRKALAIALKIETLEVEQAKVMDGIYATVTPIPAPPLLTVVKKRKMSAAGLRAIRKAQKARWAKHRATKLTVVKKKFTMSAKARKAISRAQKARWAAIRKAA